MPDAREQAPGRTDPPVSSAPPRVVTQVKATLEGQDVVKGIGDRVEGAEAMRLGVLATHVRQSPADTWIKLSPSEHATVQVGQDGRIASVAVG